MKGWFTGIVLLLTAGLAGQQVSFADMRCEVNWKEFVYVADGQAVVQNPRLKESREKALNDARKSAVGNMMRLIQRTSVSGQNPAQILARNPVVRRKITGVVITAKPIATRFVTIGAKPVAVVSLKIPVFGRNAPGTVIVEAASKGAANLGASATALDDSQSWVMQSSVAPKPLSADNSCSGYTCLMVDATGYNVERSMSPRVLKLTGDIVYTGENAPIDQVEEFGVAAYTKSLDKANRNPRCGLRPLIIKAKGAAGIRNWDIVVSDEDAKMILEENQKTGFLDKLNVIIVIG